MFRRSEEGKRIRKENMKKGVDYTPFQAKQPYLLKTGIMNTLTGALTKDNLIVLVSPKSTSTQPAFIKDTSLTTKTMETSQKSTKKNYPTLTSSWVASLAKRFQSRESVEDLMTLAEQCSSSLRGYFGKNNHAFYCLRTSKGFYLTTKETRSLPSSPRLMNWGMTVNGKCLTAKITESPRTGNECSLSDILEEHPDQKYFLSEEQTKKILGTQGKMCRTP